MGSKLLRVRGMVHRIHHGGVFRRGMLEIIRWILGYHVRGWALNHLLMCGGGILNYRQCGRYKMCIHRIHHHILMRMVGILNWVIVGRWMMLLGGGGGCGGRMELIWLRSMMRSIDMIRMRLLWLLLLLHLIWMLW